MARTARLLSVTETNPCRTVYVGNCSDGVKMGFGWLAWLSVKDTETVRRLLNEANTDPRVGCRDEMETRCRLEYRVGCQAREIDDDYEADAGLHHQLAR